MIRRRSGASTPAPSPIRRRSAPARKSDPPAEIVTGQYRNRRYASVVPRAVFVGGKPVADAIIELPARRLENAPLLAGSPGIEPQTASPAGLAATDSAGHGVAAKLAKARDMLARIVKWREHGKRPVEAAVSRFPVPNALMADKRDSGARALIGKKHGTARTHPAAMRARRPDPTKMRLRKVERGGKPAKSRAAALRADAGGG